MEPSSPAEGIWRGRITSGAIALRIVFKIIATPNGLTAEMQSPDQSPQWLAADSVMVSGATVSIAMRVGVFTGTLSADGRTLDGEWKHGGGALPLMLEKVGNEAELAPRRPQNPAKPYPYREVEVSYENPAAPGVTLAGTLTIPAGNGPFPAALLIVGSGPHDRDEPVMGHKPFLVLADYLTRKGIAVLRSDKRGIGKSSGNYVSATTVDFASDAAAGVAFLRTRSEVNAAEIGLVGHSEGATIAPMVAANDATVAFIVMMAGTGVPGDVVLHEQAMLIEAASGVSSADREKHAAAQKALLDHVKTGADDATLEQAMRERMGGAGTEEQVQAQLKWITSPWFRYFLTYDPAPTLRQVKCPVLALNGSKDLQVAPEQNLPVIRRALEDGGNRRVETIEMPGLNHLFQTATTGAPSEYGVIEETIAPVAMQKMAEWIQSTMKSRAPVTVPER